jgi:hypothetical protein
MAIFPPTLVCVILVITGPALIPRISFWVQMPTTPLTAMPKADKPRANKPTTTNSQPNKSRNFAENILAIAI